MTGSAMPELTLMRDSVTAVSAVQVLKIYSEMFSQAFSVAVSVEGKETDRERVTIYTFM